MGFGTAIQSFSRALRDPEVTQLELRSPFDNPAIPLNSPEVFNWAFNSGPVASGENVAEHNALTVSTVYACVRLISEAIGTIPMNVVDVSDQERPAVVADHSLSYLLKYKASEEHIPAVMFESLAMNLALTGNGYVEIERDARGVVTGLYPLNAQKTQPVRQDDQSIVFVTTDGMEDGKHRIIQYADMIHVPLFSADGLRGISPIAQNREELGLAQATMKMGARFHGNGAHPGGILSFKQPMGSGGGAKSEQGQQVKSAFEASTTGLNSGRIVVLPTDVTYTKIGMSMVDSEYLLSRAFSRATIAAMFRIAAHMVGSETHMSSTNFEQSSLSLQQDTLQPYLVKIQQEFNRKLLPPTGRQLSKYELRFDLTDRLRTDRKTLLDSVALGRQWGILSINDGRRELGKNPIGPAGDVYNQPTNQINAEKFAAWDPGSGESGLDNRPGQLKPAETKSVGRVQPTFYQPLIRDAVGRLSARTNRSSETFATILSPVYTTMAEQLLQEARNTFDLPDTWLPATEKLLKGCFEATEHRAKSWDSTKLTEVAVIETDKVYRSLRLNIFREAGAAIAVKE